MSHSIKRFFTSLPLLAVALLAACAAPAPAPVAPAAVPAHDMVAAIRAAGEREKSIIDVTPLSSPGIAALQAAAQADERAGHYAAAAAKFDQALQLSPDSPDLLQDRAEVAVRLKNYDGAEKLAHRSWTLGPKFGPLCARNWQTMVEMRQQAHDQAGAATARKWVLACHKPGVPRY